MNKYYLRMEGVNLNNYVYDTQRLSVIRGGGLLLLNGVTELQKAMKDKGTILTDISTGASSGLFSFSVADDAGAVKVKEEAEEFFYDHKELRHATFVVDVLPYDEEFKLIRESSLALNRWQQMQSLSLKVPENDSTKGVCEHDFIRPADPVETGPKKKTKENKEAGTRISTSAFLRHEYGRKQKQNYYKDYTKGIVNPPEFTNNFEELSANKEMGDLHHKIAFFYADGNGFGKLQFDTCLKEDEQKAFDIAIKAYRVELLTKIINACTDLLKNPKKDKLQFETLLWGGDELIFVVPAWQGWWLAEKFFEYTRNWNFLENNLTHGASLIFCHHNSPIHRIRDLAVTLAELAKKKSRKQNLLAYQVLESFDHLGTSPDEYRKKLCPPGIDGDDLIIDGDSLAGVRQAFITIRDRFPRRQLHAIIRNLHGTSVDGQREVLEDAEKMCKEIFAISESDIHILQSCFGSGALFWFHLAELWDYVGVEAGQ
ncbi:MAG TPA: hypothetical protein EYH19_06720 [Desulfocapsa sulfexigens]|nr:hypothetical protein [Desulfocapsa sulfexigens]